MDEALKDYKEHFEKVKARYRKAVDMAIFDRDIAGRAAWETFEKERAALHEELTAARAAAKGKKGE